MSNQQRQPSTQGILALGGHWEYKCHRPLDVSDPDRLAHIVRRRCALNPSHVDRMLRTGQVPVSRVMTMLAKIHQASPDRRDLKEAESLLSGGGLKWQESYQNIIVNEGLDHALDVVLSGGTQDSSWFIGLLGSSPSPLATWTATEIAANDFVNYDETVLQSFVDGGVSSQSVSNSASPATFTCSTNGSTVGGGFLIGTNAKATPAGTVYSAGAFTGGNKSLDDNDTLDVTVTYTAADA